MQESVLVTGGTGFIGFHLVKRLIKEGFHVRVLVRKESTKIARLEGLDIELHYGDICKPESLTAAFRNVSKVYHCAAHVSDWGSKEAFHQANVLGTKNVLEASVQAKINLFIGISTNDVLGRIPNQIIDESFPLKKWNEPYPDSKIEAEKLIWQFYKTHGLAVSLAYPCWVYGAEDTTFLPHLIEAIKDGSFLYWKKNAAFYPTYIENLIDLLLVMTQNKKAIGNGYLVHDGQSIALKTFCDKIADTLKLKRVKLSIPYPIAYTIAFLMENVWKILRLKSRPLLTTYIIKNFGSNMNYAIIKAEKELGWKPKYSFEEGFDITMKSLENEKDKLVRIN